MARLERMNFAQKGIIPAFQLEPYLRWLFFCSKKTGALEFSFLALCAMLVLRWYVMVEQRLVQMNPETAFGDQANIQKETHKYLLSCLTIFI